MNEQAIQKQCDSDIVCQCVVIQIWTLDPLGFGHRSFTFQLFFLANWTQRQDLKAIESVN